MNPASITKLIILASVGCAFVFLFVFFTIGFGWLASLGSALIGAAMGYLIIQRAVTQTRLRAYFQASSRAGQPFDQAVPRGTSFPTFAVPSRSAGFWARIFFIFDSTFLSLPRYQRLASVVFLLQAVVSLAAIFVFCVVQATGFEIRIMQMPSFAALFANAYPIDPDATFAKTRFNNLFLPLVSFYIVSFACFALALLRSLGPLLRDVVKHGRVWAGIIFFLFGFWLLLFAGGGRLGQEESASKNTSSMATHWAILCCLFLCQRSSR